MGISKIEVWIKEVPISWSCGSSTWSQTFYKSWINPNEVAKLNSQQGEKLWSWAEKLLLQVLDNWSPFDNKVSYKSWSCCAWNLRSMNWWSNPELQQNRSWDSLAKEVEMLKWNTLFSQARSSTKMPNITKFHPSKFITEVYILALGKFSTK